MPQLLDGYSQANLYYRDEEFSQQADQFLTKIAMDRKSKSYQSTKSQNKF